MANTNAIVLPTALVPGTTKSPENLIIYSKPKTGKTTMLSKLKDCLIIDLEKGTNKIDAMKVQASNLTELHNIIKAVEASPHKYKYVAVDTVTELEAWCEWDATVMYMKTPMGKNFNRVQDPKTGELKVLPKSQWDSVLSLAKGAGYLYLRNSFKKWMNMLLNLAPHVIFVAHVKDSHIEKKGKEVSVKDLDLTGKIKMITAQKADAIGYVYWEGEELTISFSSEDGLEAGSRCTHLKDSVIPFEWNRIFID
tara:strand:- start:5422 stop:6177 length:756 start_codon:yes stop_codon:yes gene_type:complete